MEHEQGTESVEALAGRSVADAVLDTAWTRSEAEAAKLASLRIYLGAAPGVGKPGTTMSPSQGAEGSVGYVGPSVAFDVPDGWHEFYLVTPIDFVAAYGPMQGGRDDYVAVGPIPESLSRPSEEILAELFQQPSDRVDVAEVNGVTTYSATMTRGDMTRQATIVHGPRDRYLVTCQAETAMAGEVAAGCQSIIGSLREVDPSPVTDPSGCTDRELSLIASIPLLEGAEAEPNAVDFGESCDLQVEFPSGFTGDVMATLRQALTDAGVESGQGKIDRTSGGHDVWRMRRIGTSISSKVEAFVRDGVTDRYFVSVLDG